MESQKPQVNSFILLCLDCFLYNVVKTLNVDKVSYALM